MNRTLIVAAIATVASSAALAQSSVTVYGRLNVTAERMDNNGVKNTVLNDNSSRFGFKGTEDLGSGMTAGFVLEAGFGTDTGATATNFFARQSEVNLGGAFGTIRLGNFTSEAYFATADYISMHNHDTGTSSDALYAYVGRNVNKIAYRTPEFVKGLTLEGAVSLGEGVPGLERSYDFAANYGTGPLHVGLGYEKNGTAKQVALSGLYDFGSFILGGLVQRDTDGFGVGLGNRTSFRVSGAYILGASEFHLNVGSADDYSKLNNSGARQFTLGYNYNLSKRTKVYGYYTKVDAEAATPYAGDFSSLAVGVRHAF